MNRRRALLAGVLAALAATRAMAQTPGAQRVLGWLSPLAQEGEKPMHERFIAALKAHGHVEGRDYRIESRWGDGDVPRLGALARDLVSRKPAVIVTAGTAAVAALKKETATVPIVFAAVGDPVQSGFVASLSRPGGNITGVMLRAEVLAKLLEHIRETLPAVRRIALLTHASDPSAPRIKVSFQRAAAALGYEHREIPVQQADDLGRAYAQAAKDKVQAIVVPPLSLFYLHKRKVTDLALAARLPLFTTMDRGGQDGALLSYTNDMAENYRRAAALVDRILRGANPADLPVEQPDRYYLMVNTRTAGGLGVRIPPSVLLRANEVIE